MAKKDFERRVENVMAHVVGTYQHDHPLYRETKIEQRILDNVNQRAAFVLFEQIDTNRCSAQGDGFLGDQFRYSVWFLQGGDKPRMIYEDHDYLRKSKSPITGSRGRDVHVGLEEVLEDGVIAMITPKDTQRAYGPLSQLKVKITLQGTIKESVDFVEQAKNLVKRIGPKLGYDYLKSTERVEGKNIAVLVWGAENGSTYGYDTVYLVWKDNSGKIRERIITDSRSGSAYLSAVIKTKEHAILVDVEGAKGGEFRIDEGELNL